ncbi:unnamed protein product [Protopolystoma xenopodis]|uniref:Uncharacterized protein n=1 Tax=Protopolystoma xenopodis TaxID=117903 RepID=A0A3S5B6D9_9PLAT|nr:unnamed protein product [Protopolystoma xenopodis]
MNAGRWLSRQALCKQVTATPWLHLLVTRSRNEHPVAFVSACETSFTLHVHLDMSFGHACTRRYALSVAGKNLGYAFYG